MGASDDIAVYTATREPFKRLADYHRMLREATGADLPFLHPVWQEVWLRHIGHGLTPHLVVVRKEQRPIGFTVLGVDNGRGRLVGSPDVCDYLDCVVLPDHGRGFFAALFRYAHHSGIGVLEFCDVVETSAVMQFGVPLARERGFLVLCEQVDETFFCHLPRSWDEYLATLSGKHRHEARRKLRKAQAAGNLLYRAVQEKGAIDEACEMFLRLFKESRQDKRAFLNPVRESFFRDLTKKLSAEGMAHIGLLDIDNRPVAAVWCIDYNKTRFLYNSGYDPYFRMFNPGLACKMLSIRDAIERGFTRYDFLKGAEPYKRHLGGTPEAVYRCRIACG